MANTTGKKHGGRQKGTPNKLGALAKDNIAAVASGLGGAERMLAWCKEDAGNEKLFWGTIYPKLLPLQIAGDDQNPLRVVNEVVRRIERPNAGHTNG